MERRHGVGGDAAEVEDAAEGVEAALLPPLVAVGAALDDAESSITVRGLPFMTSAKFPDLMTPLSP